VRQTDRNNILPNRDELLETPGRIALLPSHLAGRDEGDGANFHGTRRKNDTHQSTTDPDAKLYRPSRKPESKPSCLGHALGGDTRRPVSREAAQTGAEQLKSPRKKRRVWIGILALAFVARLCGDIVDWLNSPSGLEDIESRRLERLARFLERAYDSDARSLRAARAAAFAVQYLARPT
jgi:hypothetical protein